MWPIIAGILRGLGQRQLGRMGGAGGQMGQNIWLAQMMQNNARQQSQQFRDAYWDALWGPTIEQFFKQWGIS